MKTHGKGVHRFDVDENYAYMSSEMDGFVGNILVIYDIRNPSKPTEVGRWWMPGQNVAGGETPHPKKAAHRLHHGLRYKDLIYAGCWHSGVAIIDVADITKPKTLSHYQYEPECPEPSHTLLRVPFQIAGKDIAVSTEEERKHRGEDTGQAACAVPHLGRLRSDASRRFSAPIMSTSRSRLITAIDIRFGAHQLARARRSGHAVLRHLVRGGLAHSRHRRSGESRRSAASSSPSRATVMTRRSPTT